MKCNPDRLASRPILIFGAILIALVSAITYPGSWNDSSRLASVEALVDYHTWQIDDSIFVVTPGKSARTASVYPAGETLLIERGALDKMLIGGHYYSDKSPVPSLAMAAVYKVLQLATGLAAAKNPALFCYVLTLIFSGMAYVIAVCCVDAMAAMLGLSCLQRLLFSYSFALGTVALPYSRQVNNHIMLLAVVSAIFPLAIALARREPGRLPLLHLTAIGTLTGIGYTIDLGAGPILVLCVIAFIIMQTRSWKALFVALTFAFPWFLLHHVLNYHIGGTFKPANANAAYFAWPGCPFNAQNLTGGWAHPNVWHFLIYAIDMLFGKKGFFGHNLPIYLFIPAVIWLLRGKRMGKDCVCYFALGLIAGTWLIYAATSNNYSGLCCSIRWFVPLLAPFYYIVGVFLKEHPDFTIDFLILSSWGLVVGLLMWMKGPWMQHMLPGFWFIQAGALISWALWRFRAGMLQRKS